MTMSPIYQAVLEDLAREIALESPADLVAAEELIIDDHSVIFHYKGDDQGGDLMFFSRLGIPHTSNFTSVARRLLEANCLWSGTNGCTLGLEKDSGHVMVCACANVVGLQGATLAGMLDAFIDTVIEWKEIVAGKEEPQNTAQDPGTFGSFAMRA
jgi:hypothetical protein